nr:MAG TPA: hypothetical protein [Caudoviricetes sp.]
MYYYSSLKSQSFLVSGLSKQRFCIALHYYYLAYLLHSIILVSEKKNIVYLTHVSKPY